MKKIIFIILALICYSNSVVAQLAVGKSASQLMIEKSVIDGLYIVAQDYQLCDTITGESYGRNNKEQFNTIYSIGIAINGKLVLNDRALNPHKYDNQFIKYKNFYKPINSNRKIRNWVDSEFSDFSITNDSLISRSFLNNEDIPKETGWLVTIFDNQNSNGQNLEISVYARDFICASDTTINVPDLSAEKILGGFYMIPTYDNPGEIKFIISGYLKEKANDKWVLSPISVDNTIKDTHEINSEENPLTSPSDDLLTPITENKTPLTEKKKKPKTTKKK